MIWRYLHLVRLGELLKAVKTAFNLIFVSLVSSSEVSSFVSLISLCPPPQWFAKVWSLNKIRR